LRFDASECHTRVIHVEPDEQNIKTKITHVPTHVGFWMESARSMSGGFNLKGRRTTENGVAACLHFCGICRFIK